MTSIQCENFQQTVSSYLLRHQSILDLLSKMMVTTGCVNRAITKSVTSCGCLKIHAKKRPLPPDADLKDCKDFFSSHLEGQLCENCRDIIINEMGKNLFYFAALCSTLDINLQEVLDQENDKVTTLGHFNMT
ncbi:MAG: DUF1573 domain-containing protein [Firmicutes bacterium HGW-Firmicutes-12]|nr:MAG: DUF1573 domain-containing protein [Firmicutes bacterium HGW-Firmicutes-12]